MALVAERNPVQYCAQMGSLNIDDLHAINHAEANLTIQGHNLSSSYSAIACKPLGLQAWLLGGTVGMYAAVRLD